MATVAEIMRREPIRKIDPDAVLRKAAKLMTAHKVGSLLVADESNRLRGIITERDIVKAASEHADFDKDTVSKYMSKGLIVARPEDSVVSAAQKMLNHGIRHLPVVDSTGKIVGIISMRDLLRFILSESEFP